jgi:dUTP pyrophosphatase
LIIINLGNQPFEITKGMRLAQMVIAAYARAELTVVADLDDTRRGAGGFGHTGLSNHHGLKSV